MIDWTIPKIWQDIILVRIIKLLHINKTLFVLDHLLHICLKLFAVMPKISPKPKEFDPRISIPLNWRIASSGHHFYRYGFSQYRNGCTDQSKLYHPLLLFTVNWPSSDLDNSMHLLFSRYQNRNCINCPMTLFKKTRSLLKTLSVNFPHR